MIKVVPTITAENAHIYRSEIERVAGFAPRIHIDFSDGEFAPNKLVKLEQAWWPEDKQIDFHVMYRDPGSHMESIIALGPDLAVLHAESDGDITDLLKQLEAVDIKPGLALLQGSKPNDFASQIKAAKHVLIFGGHLGYHGGDAQLQNLTKVNEVKEINPKAEIAWDGGVNEDNASKLAAGGIDVLNVGGYIHKSDAPQDAYDIIVGNANT